MCRSKLKIYFAHIRVFDRRIKVTVILTSVKNTNKPPLKINSPRLVLTGTINCNGSGLLGRTLDGKIARTKLKSLNSTQPQLFEKFHILANNFQLVLLASIFCGQIISAQICTSQSITGCEGTYLNEFVMSERKAVIKNADMSEDMQQDAVDCASQALEKYNIEKVRNSRLLT